MREKRESERKRERDQKLVRRRHHCRNVTAATVPKPDVTSARPAFDEKSEKERQRPTEREDTDHRERESDCEKREKEREREHMRK